ncbi:MAG TPA: SCO family protein [Verrucomicrobiae bacterium]|nr:SCO family protein [Verrucomicrobiae bacterium]
MTTYSVKGAFLESRSAGRVAIIAHEPVPGYMDAMTMPFPVKNPNELSGLQPGDPIVFRLSVTEDDDWIDNIKKIKGRVAKERVSEPLTETERQLEVGTLVPEFVFTNQSGSRINRRDFKGQALAITFFFSRCPLPTFCPRMNNNFATVQQALKLEGTRTNWQLLSISFDPAFDTPEHLADVAALQGADSSHWTFATSTAEEVRRLGGAFGLKFWRESGSFSHNLRTVVVDAEGRVQKVLNGNEWKPTELIAEMRKAMEAR